MNAHCSGHRRFRISYRAHLEQGWPGIILSEVKEARDLTDAIHHACEIAKAADWIVTAVEQYITGDG